MYAILVVLLLSFVFLLVGRAGMAAARSQQTGMATLFFAGELVSVWLFGVMARIVPMQIAFVCWIILAVVCIAYVLLKLRMHWPRPGILLVWLGLAVMVTGILLFWWNMPADTVPDPVMRHNGSIHTGRSLAIAGYMVDQNQLTGIGQNFGQSLLLCITGMTGATLEPFTITLWIAVNAAFFMLLLYEIFSIAISNKRLAIVGTAFVMFCGVSLSFTWNNLVDIGNPFIISGYADNYLGLASLLLLGLVVFEANAGRLSISQIIFIIILLSGNHIYAPQNLVVLLALLLLLLLYKAIRKQWHPARRLFLWNIIVAVIIASGFFFGGMFLDKKRTDDHIPFASQVNVSGGQLRLLPHLSSKMYNDGVFTFRKASTVPGISSDTAVSPAGNLKLAAAHLEADIWESLRLVFFPLALLLFSAVIITRDSAAYNRWWKGLTVAGLAFFLCAWPIAYFLTVGQYKMELNRFLYPFILCGLMTWPFLLQQYSGQKRMRWLLWGCGVAGILPFFTELLFRLFD